MQRQAAGTSEGGALGWERREKAWFKDNTWVLPVLVGAILLLLVFLLWIMLHAGDHARLKLIIKAESERIAAVIDGDLRMRIPALQRMARRWDAEGGSTRIAWEADARSYLADMPGFQSLAWVGPSGRVRWIMPASAPPPPMLPDGQQHPDRRESTAGPVIPLGDHGHGFAIYLPLNAHGRADGFIVAVVQADAWLNDVLMHSDEINLDRDYGLSIRFGGQALFSVGHVSGDPLVATWRQRNHLELLNRRLVVTVWPTARFFARTHSEQAEVALIGGLGLVLLAVYMVFLYQRASYALLRGAAMNASLKAEISERHRVEAALRDSESQSRAVFEAVLDSIVTIDMEGHILSANPAAQAMFGYPQSEMLGSNVSMLMPAPQAGEHDGYIRGYLDTGERKIIGIGREVEGQRRDGRAFPLALSISEMRVSGERRFVGVMRDITARRRAEEEIRHMATHDPLTDLPTARLANDRLEQAIAEARRTRKLMAVMFLDLDGFKPVNDTYGHVIGDEVLKQVATRLSEGLREVDTVARIGGDEFLIVAGALDGREGAERIARKVADLLHPPLFTGNGEPMYVGCSLGVALYPQDGDTPETLINQADRAMYRIKHSTKDGYAFAEPEGKDGDPGAAVRL